jgi:adenylate kinase family enzyme
MRDDETGDALMQRPDDTAEALVKRLQGYHAETVPVLEHYRPKGAHLCPRLSAHICLWSEALVKPRIVLSRRGHAGICSAVNSNQGMEKVWAEVEAGLTTGKK